MIPTPIISLKEARKILGPSSKAMSDEQLLELLEMFELYAQAFLAYEGSKNGIIEDNTDGE